MTSLEDFSTIEIRHHGGLKEIIKNVYDVEEKRIFFVKYLEMKTPSGKISIKRSCIKSWRIYDTP